MMSQKNYADQSAMHHFMRCFSANSQDIQIVEHEPFEDDCIAKWSNLVCRRCGDDEESTEKFVDHILWCQRNRIEWVDYQDYSILSKDAKEALDDAENERAKSSFLLKTIADDNNHKLIMPLDSPLVPYVTQEMTIYSKPTPTGNNQRMLSASVRKGDTSQRLLFISRETAPTSEDIALQKNIEDMEFIEDFPTIPDIILDASSRTDEETRDLIQALGFKKKKQVSQADIIKKTEKKYGVKLSNRKRRGPRESMPGEQKRKAK